MAQQIKLFYVDEEQSLKVNTVPLEHPAFELLGSTGSFGKALQELAHLLPDVILYRPSETGEEFPRIEKVSLIAPQAALMILSTQTNSDYVRKCLKAGASDYLLLPFEDTVLQSEVIHAFQRLKRKQKKQTISILMENFTGGPKLISFLSAKGGVGKTTLSSNTAVALALQGKKVALVDLDLQMGGISTLLNLEPRHTLADLSELSLAETSEGVVDSLELHESGVMVLCAPTNPMDADKLTPALIRNILQTLQTKFDHVIVDLAPSVNPYFFAAYELSDLCFLVSTPNLAVLETNRNLLKLLANHDYDLKKIQYILNCVGVKSGVKQADVERLLKGPIGYSIEYDYDFVEKALNKGTPFVTTSQKRRISREILELALNISDDSRKARKDSKQSS